MASIIQAHGIGPLRPNLALFSWYDFNDPARSNAGRYEAMVQTVVRHGCNVGVVYAPDEGWARVPEGQASPSTIAVWWSDDRTGQLLTLLAWL